MSIDTRKIISNAVRSIASFEGLESRQLMSAAGVKFHNNTLIVNGTAGSDQINIAWTKAGRQARVNLNGNLSKAYDARQIFAMQINAGGGNNRIVVDADVRASTAIITGKGNDTIISGMSNDGINSGAGNDQVDTGAGNDIVYAGAGNDTINGGLGNDLIAAEAGDDVVNAGTGVDQLFGGSGTNHIIADSDDIVDGGQVAAGSSTIVRETTPAPIVAPVVAPTRTRISYLSLVNADTGVSIPGYDHLTDGVTLDLANLPARVTIVAVAGGGTVESARFQLSDGSLNRVENNAYLTATPTNANGTLAAWAPTTGSYTMSITPYSADNAGGAAGQTYTLKMNVKRTAAAVSNTATPTWTPAPTTTNGNTSPIASPVLDNGVPRISVTAFQGLSITAGQPFHVEATGTTLPGVDVEDASFAWNFGDAAARHNDMAGFNAAHVYDRPGTYSVRLTVTAPNGTQRTSTLNVNVAPATGRTLYVAANGNDAADGSGPFTALRTLARANELANADTTILLRRGDTFAQSSTLELKQSGLTIATFGLGNAPTILWTGARDRSNVIWVNSATRNVTIRGLSFDSIYNGDTEQTGMPTAILAGGTSVTIRDNTFLNVGYAVNGNQRPRGLLVQDNRAPSDVGVRDYFVWVQGTDIVISGNEVANSTREHNVRVGGAERLAIVDNRLTNLDRTSAGDRNDNAKGTIACQKGAFAYIAGNQLRGPSGFGPLGGETGFGDKTARFVHATFVGNVQYGGTFYLQHGAEHVSVRGNTLFQDDAVAFDIVAYNASYGRGVVDASFDGNVVVNNGTRGNFLVVEGAAQGISLTDNVYVAPYLAPGSFGAAAVFVNGGDLSWFTRIDHNTWPSTSRASAYVGGGVNFVGLRYDAAGHRDANEWNTIPQVGDDQFTDVTIDSAQAITNGLRLAA